MVGRRVDRREVFIAGFIGVGSVVSAGIASAVALGVSDSKSDYVVNVVAVVSMGLPFVLLFSLALSLALALPATLFWYSATGQLRKWGMSKRWSAQLAMLLVTCLAFMGIYSVAAVVPPLGAIGAQLIVPAAFSWMLGSRFFGCAPIRDELSG